MERVVVMCVTHLLMEANLTDEEPKDLSEAMVCDMVAISSTITHFYNVAFTFTRNDRIRE